MRKRRVLGEAEKNLHALSYKTLVSPGNLVLNPERRSSEMANRRYFHILILMISMQIGSDGVDKYSALRGLLSNYTTAPPPKEPEPIDKRAYPSARMRWRAPLFSSLDQVGGKPIFGTRPAPFEK